MTCPAPVFQLFSQRHGRENANLRLQGSIIEEFDSERRAIRDLDHESLQQWTKRSAPHGDLVLAYLDLQLRPPFRHGRNPLVNGEDIAHLRSPMLVCVRARLWRVDLGRDARHRSLGLHMGMMQGLLATLVADAAPPAVRGTVFGVFNFASSVAVHMASLIAGLLWEIAGPPMTFVAGAVFAAIALVGMNAVVLPKRAFKQP